MKTLALVAILFLHATGLWSAAPHDAKGDLLARASETLPMQTAALPAPAPAALPVRTSEATTTLDAASSLAIDRATATVLYSNSANERRPIASVTKMVTALVVSSRHSLDERVTIPTLPKYPVEAETMGLVAGDTFRLGDLVEAALVPSANDAADALAIIDAGSTSAFTERMNTKMSEWEIGDTHFASASGLVDADNYSTATSLAKIAGLLLTNPDLTKIVGYTAITITSGSGRTYNLKSTNDLLASGQFYGIKTGYTLAAGECFVGLARINGHDVITVVLGSSNRFGTTTTLTNFIGRTWQWL